MCRNIRGARFYAGRRLPARGRNGETEAAKGRKGDYAETPRLLSHSPIHPFNSYPIPIATV